MRCQKSWRLVYETGESEIVPGGEFFRSLPMDVVKLVEVVLAGGGQIFDDHCDEGTVRFVGGEGSRLDQFINLSI